MFAWQGAERTEHGPERFGEYVVSGECIESKFGTMWRLRSWKESPSTMPSTYQIGEDGIALCVYGNSIGGRPTFAPGEGKALHAALEKWEQEENARRERQEPFRTMLQMLERCGVNFSTETDAPYGRASFSLSVDQALSFLEDQETAVASLWCVTKQQYREWREADRRQRCSALTKKGKCCRNYVPADKELTPFEWVQAQGSYCKLHEGEQG